VWFTEPAEPTELALKISHLQRNWQRNRHGTPAPSGSAQFRGGSIASSALSYRFQREVPLVPLFAVGAGVTPSGERIPGVMLNLQE
jgi:hypothetical protein